MAAAWTLTTLTVSEQISLETDIVEACGCTYPTARKIIATAVVPRLNTLEGDTVRRVLDRAAADVERMHRLHTTPYDQVASADKDWMTAPDQQLIHGLPGLPPFATQLSDVGTWLRARSLRATP